MHRPAERPDVERVRLQRTLSAPSLLWFRRDLRLADHPALRQAAAAGPVVPLFVVNPFVLRLTGPVRSAFLFRCLRALDDSMGGRLVVRVGDPHEVVPLVAKEVEAAAVYVSADFGGYGRARDRDVAPFLEMGGRQFLPVGSPYAVDPGTIRNGGGQPFQVFSPFYRAWRAHGWAPPMAPPAEVAWVDGVGSDDLPSEPRVEAQLPPAGEAAALARLDAFLAGPASHYDTLRDRPAADASSRLSPYLKFGCIHPRQVLAGSEPPRPTRSSGARSPGASSTPTSSGTGPGRARDRSSRPWPECVWTPAHRPTSGSGPGLRDGRVIRSSTPACASCWSRPGCRTGCAWSSPASS